MSDGSKIEWCDATWQPITGCSVVSAGCKHCYAMRLAGTRLRHHPSRAGLTRRTSAGPVWTGAVRWNEQWLDQPQRWRKPRRIFVCAHGDLFHDSVPESWIDTVFAVMAETPWHTFQVLTKRPQRMRDYLSAPSVRIANDRAALALGAAGRIRVLDDQVSDWPLPNVWLGVSVEDQKTADERIPLLLQTPAAVRFVSIEPMLGPVDLTGEWLTAQLGAYPFRRLPAEHRTRMIHLLNWVISGGESGPGARPSHPDWFRSLRDQCIGASVPFFFKQWGEWQIASAANGHRGGLMPATGERYMWIGSDGRAQPETSNGLDDTYAMARVGKRAAGRLLDGRTWDEFPAVAP